MQKYANDNGFTNTSFFVDDGYSGTNFDRPDWQRLIALVEDGGVSTIIVKDMSRLGRDYLKVGYYTEVLFPGCDIRFIAINNGVDSDNQQDSDFTPFLNIINEWYAKDTSKKIRAVFKAKGEAGKPLCTNPPYEYVKDPEDKLHWIVEETAADVVRRIFKLCMEGYGPSQIANILEEDKVLVPSAYYKSLGISYPAPVPENPYSWQSRTVADLLSHQEYLGHTVNFKTYKKSYKSKKKLQNDPSKWQIFENTHEAIIDQETFDIVQRIRDGRRRRTPMGEMPILSGMLYCADCGAKLYQVRAKGWTNDKEHLVCATYRKKGKHLCSSHQIRNVVVEEILLAQLKEITAYAREHEDEFIEMVTKSSAKTKEKEIRDSGKECEQSKARISKLDTLIEKLYEDNVEGKISDERFMKMTTSYEVEQKQLEERVVELQTKISQIQERSANIDVFLNKVHQYTDIQELDAEIIRTFISRINVYAAEKVEGKRRQRIQIIYNCIGEFQPPKHKKNGIADMIINYADIFRDYEIPS